MGKLSTIFLSLAMTTVMHANAQTGPVPQNRGSQRPVVVGTVEALDLNSRTITLLGQSFSIPFGTPIRGFDEKGTTNLRVIGPGMTVRLMMAPSASEADPSRVTSISVVPD